MIAGILLFLCLASSAAPSAGDVGIPAILPSSRPINRVGLIETNKAASISPEPKTSGY